MRKRRPCLFSQGGKQCNVYRLNQNFTATNAFGGDLGDVDGDGDLDAIVANAFAPSELWRTDGTSQFTFDAQNINSNALYLPAVIR